MQTPKKRKVQTTKPVTVSNKPKKKGPVGRMGELRTRVEATRIKLRERMGDPFGILKEGIPRTPQEQRILNKDARIYNKKAQSEKLEKMKEMGKQFEDKRKVAKLKEKGYKKIGFQLGGMTSGDFEDRQNRKVRRAETKAAVAKIEGEGTVAQKRDNRSTRIATAIGTARTKTPKTVSTSTSTSTTNTGNSKPSLSNKKTDTISTTRPAPRASSTTPPDPRQTPTRPTDRPIPRQSTPRPTPRPTVTGTKSVPKAMYGASMTPPMMQSEMMKKGGKVKKVMKKKK